MRISSDGASRRAVAASLVMSAVLMEQGLADVTAREAYQRNDNPAYRSKMGMGCEQHTSLHCQRFSMVGFSLDEVDELLRECPSSCSSTSGTGSETVSLDFPVLSSEAASLPKAKTSRNLRILNGATCFGGSCSDDPGYNDFGINCSFYGGINCKTMLLVGYSVDQVNNLISSCPCSCNTECGTFEPFQRMTKPPTLVTISPTEAPTTAPTDGPTTTPTQSPTDVPTAAPTTAPTVAPTTAPTRAPTGSPTEGPTHPPTIAPTATPTTTPTEVPTNRPTKAPTDTPTSTPTQSRTDATLPSSSDPAQNHINGLNHIDKDGMPEPIVLGNQMGPTDQEWKTDGLGTLNHIVLGEENDPYFNEPNEGMNHIDHGEDSNPNFDEPIDGMNHIDLGEDSNPFLFSVTTSISVVQDNPRGPPGTEYEDDELHYIEFDGIDEEEPVIVGKPMFPPVDNNDLNHVETGATNNEEPVIVGMPMGPTEGGEDDDLNHIEFDGADDDLNHIEFDGSDYEDPVIAGESTVNLNGALDASTLDHSYPTDRPQNTDEVVVQPRTGAHDAFNGQNDTNRSLQRSIAALWVLLAVGLIALGFLVYRRRNTDDTFSKGGSGSIFAEVTVKVNNLRRKGKITPPGPMFITETNSSYDPQSLRMDRMEAPARTEAVSRPDLSDEEQSTNMFVQEEIQKSLSRQSSRNSSFSYQSSMYSDSTWDTEASPMGGSGGGLDILMDLESQEKAKSRLSALAPIIEATSYTEDIKSCASPTDEDGIEAGNSTLPSGTDKKKRAFMSMSDFLKGYGGKEDIKRSAGGNEDKNISRRAGLGFGDDIVSIPSDAPSVD